ncbi:reverse transcriptase domain-containing protein, partial [Tanacetum coccineum]
LLKELTTSKAPEKVLIKEEAKSLITKSVNSISLIREEEGKNDIYDVATGDDSKETDGADMEVSVKEVETKNRAESGAKNKPIKKPEKEEVVEAPIDQGSDVNVMSYSTYMKLTDERHAETEIRLSLSRHSYIYPLGIAEDVLVEIAEHVYPMDFVILDIKEDKKRPFILGTPFLTTAKAVIKFDKVLASKY